MTKTDTSSLFKTAAATVDAADRVLDAARRATQARVANAGAGGVDQEQEQAHGYAWLATYVEALRQMLRWARDLEAAKKFGTIEQLIFEIAFREYAPQIVGGIPMSQGEIVRAGQLGVPGEVIGKFMDAAGALIHGESEAKARLAKEMAEHPHAVTFGNIGLDEDLALVRDQFRKFVLDKVAPHAHGWHLRDELIPISVVEEMGALGVFGLTIPEAHGGSGLGKLAMCVVSEELSRGYIGVGSLGTRSEIAGELILGGGTDAQKKYWLPKIASGEILPTAVFTEPNTGSDLGSLRTRAVREGDVWKVTGNKTWITHAARADMMTLLVRTNNAPAYRGLSMFLAPKPRGTSGDPFPAKGMSGGEIGVLGYRGMKEFEIGFDGFEIPHANLLGGEEGQGFKQLMVTFESARIQTAARAVGVAQSALDLGLRYALDRVQFANPIINFPRVANKLAMMAVEIMIARQLTYYAAREKDAGRRCDLEAGMAKLLGARVAWAAADNAVQIHGGNGFAMEYPVSRVLCDARILNIFEGAAEIQAQVIARRLLEEKN
ncbi:MAG: acyl-CoA dehydrogenase [Alphaproteobacteria bacterium]|nr:acyl-CoA dehydrogenase [Alphaproteobacteria bacterium]